ncbi:hypothetical protein [Roseisolibacter agri]|uniref:Cytochrome c domain-containing protein n=1 Tax=Roseisolibacter agri TaxID=2014610 RepID=A0AA37QI31_9BACT|nr:hypothetical protein [Roseisolibacter agri]GLC26895.1 hypothetical protein rosag_34080 [Roseisolibacter agri]
MSRDRSRDRSRERARSAALRLALATLACGACTSDARDAGAAKDSAGGAAAAARPDTARAAYAPPSPGFTSAYGTVAATDTAALVAAAHLASLAPGLSDAVTARAAREERESLKALPAGAGRELVVGACLTCHSATMLTQQHKDTAGWNKTVTQMVGWGAPLPKEQQPTLVAYLAEHFPPLAPGPQTRPVPP